MSGKPAIGILLIGLLALLAACASAQRAAPAAEVMDQASSSAGRPAAKAVNEQGLAATDAFSPSGVSERMIIRTANLNLVVTDAAAAQQAIIDMVNGMGGYVADSGAWREGEQLRGRMTVRVPAERLDALLAGMRELAVRVQQETISGQDVTEEFTDLTAQLTNLEATEKELRELLTEVRQKTQKAEDVLAIYRELTTIRGEIERVKGRMQYLSSMTALATVSVELIPDVLAKPVIEPGWRPLETLKNAGRALVNAMKGLVDGLIWLVIYIVPLLIVIAIPIVAVVLLVRRLARRKSTTK